MPETRSLLSIFNYRQSRRLGNGIDFLLFFPPIFQLRTKDDMIITCLTKVKSDCRFCSSSTNSKVKVTLRKRKPFCRNAKISEILYTCICAKECLYNTNIVDQICNHLFL